MTSESLMSKYIDSLTDADYERCVSRLREFVERMTPMPDGWLDLVVDEYD